MKAMHKSLELIVKISSKQPDLAGQECRSTEGGETEVLPDPEQLGILELFYQFYKEDGDEMVGNPRSVFAAFNGELGKLTVFSENDDAIDFFSHRTRGIIAALELAQAGNASFSVDGSSVRCELGGVSAVGASYGEAALRALLKHQRLELSK